jgi:hypothetical protein
VPGNASSRSDAIVTLRSHYPIWHLDGESIIMLSCKDVCRLVSESLDRKLPWHQRMQMRVHLLLCSACSCFQRQMQFLRRAARFRFDTGENVETAPAPRLSPDWKEGMKRDLS